MNLAIGQSHQHRWVPIPGLSKFPQRLCRCGAVRAPGGFKSGRGSVTLSPGPGLESVIDIDQQAAPAAPGAGITRLFMDSADGALKARRGAGSAETILPAAAAGGDFDVLATANGGVTVLGNSVGPANAISFTLPGGTLGVAGLLVIAFEYFMTQTSGGNLTLNRRLKVGGVEAADVTFADSIASGVQKRYWCIFQIRPNGAQNLNDCFTLDQATQVGRNTTAVGSGLDLDTNFDLSVDKTIEVSFDWFPSAPGVTPSVKTLGPVQAWAQKAA